MVADLSMLRGQPSSLDRSRARPPLQRARTEVFTKRGRPARGADSADGGKRSARTARARWPAAAGRCSRGPAWPGARSSDADTAGTYHQSALHRQFQAAPAAPPARSARSGRRLNATRPPPLGFGKGDQAMSSDTRLVPRWNPAERAWETT